MHPRNLHIIDFNYFLPEDRIAVYPLPQRDQSKLLVFRQGQIKDAHFHELNQFLTSDHILIGNDTRVIPARLHFRKASGASIEVFCLEPTNKSHQDAMSEKGISTWNCMVGGAKKWKGDEVLEAAFSRGSQQFKVFARKLARDAESFQIEFSWEDDRIVFSEILDAAGELPLPPYFNRRAEQSDYQRYQTIFAQQQGSVAAPTAGLHFTNELIHSLKSKGVHKRDLTLHVGAGTFKPVSAETMEGHSMHNEKFSVSKDLLQFLISNHGKKIVTIGTTTTRALESLYWLGVKWMQGDLTSKGVQQWEPYEIKPVRSPLEVLEFLHHKATQSGLDEIQTETTIMIAPGYPFQFVDGLITNFHMPKSTLLLLVAAVTGQDDHSGADSWRTLYTHALENNYRFLSYGDSSLLFVKR